jgi:hypothetical protein
MLRFFLDQLGPTDEMHESSRTKPDVSRTSVRTSWAIRPELVQPAKYPTNTEIQTLLFGKLEKLRFAVFTRPRQKGFVFSSKYA